MQFTNSSPTDLITELANKNKAVVQLSVEKQLESCTTSIHLLKMAQFFATAPNEEDSKDFVCYKVEIQWPGSDLPRTLLRSAKVWKDETLWSQWWWMVGVPVPDWLARSDDLSPDYDVHNSSPTFHLYTRLCTLYSVQSILRSNVAQPHHPSLI